MGRPLSTVLLIYVLFDFANKKVEIFDELPFLNQQITYIILYSQIELITY